MTPPRLRDPGLSGGGPAPAVRRGAGPGDAGGGGRGAGLAAAGRRAAGRLGAALPGVWFRGAGVAGAGVSGVRLSGAGPAGARARRADPRGSGPPGARARRARPSAVRPRGRLRRGLLAGVVAASVALPVAAAARPAAVPAPVPAVPFDVAAATPAALAERYAANRDGIRAAERMAAAHGDRRRAGSLRAMAAPGRHFLSFDGRAGGRSAEVFGDLAHARRIAVLVPGTDTGLDSYGRFRAGAEALRRALLDRAAGAPGSTGDARDAPDVPDARDTAGAVVAWLGYAPPSTVSAASLTAGRAEAAAPRLRTFVRSLAAARPDARISLLCHSYGSVVCGRAAAGLRVADVVLYGSPGVGAGSAAELDTPATVWAGRGAGDWVGDVPHVRVPLLVTTVGFGPDPVSAGFGACPFAAGPGGHSDYLSPGSVPLRSLARIVTGEATCAGRAAATADGPQPCAPSPDPEAGHARAPGPGPARGHAAGAATGAEPEASATGDVPQPRASGSAPGALRGRASRPAPAFAHAPRPAAPYAPRPALRGCGHA